MLPDLASVVVGLALAAAAGAKAADPVASAVGLGTYGLPAVAVWPLVIAELAAGSLALSGLTAWPAFVLLASFACAQAAALAAGRGGAPCGCGGRGRLTWWSFGRVCALAVVGLIAVNGGSEGWSGGWAVALVVGGAAGAFGLGAWSVFRARPAGALDIAGEGPEIGSRLEVPEVVPAMREQARGGARVLLFTSEACSLCARLRGAGVGLPLVQLDEARDAAAWAAANVPGSPYAIVLDEHNRVRAKGTPNTRRQLTELTAAAQLTTLDADVEVLAGTRRTFLHRTAAAAGALAAGGAVKPGAADAFHFCGHIYTTDGCPHPTGLPRIDAKGLPLRGRDGKRIDDLGRLIDAQGMPIDDAGNLMLDADGTPLPPATRTRVCDATAAEFGITTRTDGSWYRCCNGHVRKLVDCCTTGTERINGDRALRGYCYGKRRVFCVMYFQTRVPC